MWGNHLLSRFFWLVKCPKSSTKQILNANGTILTLRAWQRSKSIVYQHKDRSFKSNQVKLLEMIWNDMKCKDSSPKWYLKSLSWCGSGLHKSIWPYLVFLRCGVGRRWMFQHCGNAKKFQRIILICSLKFHNAGFWHVQPLPLICEEWSRKALNDQPLPLISGVDD